MVIRVWQWCLLLLLTSSGLAQAATLQAIPDRTRVGLEESFQVELRATGSVDGDPDLSVLERDFELLGRSQSSQYQFINGKSSRSTSWLLTLLPRRAGRLQLPPLCIDGECSDSVPIEVLPAGQQTGGTAGKELLLEVEATPEQLRVQAQLLLTVRVLTRVNLLQAALGDPQAEGVEAVVQKLGDDRQYETRRDGLLYRVVERRYAIFPQQSGTLTIPPLRLDVQIGDGGRGSLFDLFARHTRQLRRRSSAIVRQVLPAETADGRNWLPASDLQLQDDWQVDPPQLKVGEPATRTLTLIAEGLPAAQLPQLQFTPPEGFKSYPDQPKREDRVGEQGVTGSLEQKVALVPTRPGTFRLPELRVDWWDLQAERWRQATLPALELEVLPGEEPAAVAPPLAPAKEAPPRVAETAPAEAPKSSAGAPAEPTPTAGFWPWLSLALGLGWLLTLLLWLRSLRNRRRASTASSAERKRPDSKAARSELFRALQGSDRGAVRRALLVWGEALAPERPPRNLEQLAELCGSPLAEQLAEFAAACYGRTVGSWDADALQQAVRQVEQQRATSATDRLPPLYPN